MDIPHVITADMRALDAFKKMVIMVYVPPNSVLISQGIGGMPVVDDQGKIIGNLSLVRRC
jgi:CBS domain-containing protein